MQLTFVIIVTYPELVVVVGGAMFTHGVEEEEDVGGHSTLEHGQGEGNRNYLMMHVLLCSSNLYL